VAEVRRHERRRPRGVHLSDAQRNVHYSDELGRGRSETRRSEGRNTRRLIPLVPAWTCDCSASRRCCGQADPRPTSPLQGRDHSERLHATGGPRDVASRGRFREVGVQRWRAASQSGECMKRAKTLILCIWAAASRVCACFVQITSIGAHLHNKCPAWHFEIH
jgi:hypothetical protein